MIIFIQKIYRLKIAESIFNETRLNFRSYWIGIINIIFLIVLFLTTFHSCSGPVNQDYSPYLEFQAKFENDTLVSNSFPIGKISFDQGIEYIGSESFILYQVARCEIHLFAELDTLGGYKRLYWIQYEGYLPKKLLPFPLKLKPGGPKYDYSEDPYRENLDGNKFYVKTGLFPIEFSKAELTSVNNPEDSDFIHVGRLFHHHGVDINGEVLSVRMVHLNPLSKKELMIIYYESVKDDALQIEKLNNLGKDSPFWDEVSQLLRERALAGIHIQLE